jgi:hypothetical protein
MWPFWAGFFAGFFANLVFGMLTRLLPAKWVRYQVHIEKLDRVEDMHLVNWLVTVRIQPPSWRRILMEPLREYLLVEAKLGNGAWLPSKWAEGDINVSRLLADAAMSVPAFVFIEKETEIYLADSYPENPIVQDGGYDVWVRVIRSLDGSVADEVGIAVIKLNWRVTAAISRGQTNKEEAEK